MQINRTLEYQNGLFAILDYIAQDRISAAENFVDELDNLINDLSNFPFKYRKSIYFQDENIRDMIYKGYTIVYRVNTEKERIEILRIFNKNKPPIEQGKIDEHSRST